jgi:hypothetical protein
MFTEDHDGGGNPAPEDTTTVKIDKSAPALDTDSSDGTDGITPDSRQSGVGRAIEPSANLLPNGGGGSRVVTLLRRAEKLATGGSQRAEKSPKGTC